MLHPAIHLLTRARHGEWLARCRLALCLCCIIVFPSPLRADHLPKFTDPEVNAYVKSLAQFRDRYLVAVAAARHGDDSELKRMDAAFPGLQQQAVQLFDKLDPSETKRFTAYVTDCGQAMMDAAFGLSRARSR